MPGGHGERHSRVYEGIEFFIALALPQAAKAEALMCHAEKTALGALLLRAHARAPKVHEAVGARLEWSKVGRRVFLVGVWLWRSALPAPAPPAPSAPVSS